MKTVQLIVVLASVSFGLCENIFYDKLDKLADYCLRHGETVDSGTLLGIYFAEGQLLAKKEDPTVSKLLIKLEKVRESFGGVLGLREIDRKILNASLFTRSFPLRFGEISKHQPIEFLSTNFYLNTVNDERNMPNGFHSDRCLSEIFENCQISEFCWKVESPAITSFGYSLTHKFIFHLLNHIACNADNFLQTSKQLCGKIHSEATFISTKTSIVPELKDLLMEQIFLCSFTGFGEFMNNDWVSSIISWQNSEGCFTYDNISCSSHMNGLGAASLALFGRTLAEM